jgi:energy-coupling factor transport system permease protein
VRASFRYLGRGSWLAERDPRTKLIAAALFVAGAIQLRDPRQLLLAFILALGYYATARIPFVQVWRQWAYLTVVIVFIAGINTVITGGRAGDFEGEDVHVLFELPFGIPVTAEAVSLSVSQILRFLAIAAVSFPIAYAIAPGDMAVAFRRLGLPDRLAVAVDLTIRFLPTLVQEFVDTIDAQRVRGFEPLPRSGGPVTRIKRLAPIFVPVTVGTLAGAEDTIDAMDLRGFGTGKRTWYRHLRMDGRSWLVVAAFLAFLLLATFLNVTGRSEHYLLPIFVP